MSSGPVYMTREGVAKIENDLRQLKGKGRKEIAEKIAYARSHGDLSENADYDAAKHEQELKNNNTDKTVEYTLVSAEEADFQANKLAVSSPLGKALLGKTIGDTVITKVPAGDIVYEILEIGKID